MAELSQEKLIQHLEQYELLAEVAHDRAVREKAVALADEYRALLSAAGTSRPGFIRPVSDPPSHH